jgi:hypothetical protein
MAMTQSQCESTLNSMTPVDEARFLAYLGNWLTIVGRESYVVQSPELHDVVPLRELNEISHRIYAQIRSILTNGVGDMSSEVMAAWVTGEGKSMEFRGGCFYAFEKAFENFKFHGVRSK